TILFIANGTDPPFDYNAYGLRLRPACAAFIKQHGDQNQVDNYPEALATFDDTSGTWTHYIITRDSTGTFYVYINATSSPAEPAMTIINTDYDYSTRMVIYHRGNFASCYRNIAVNDTIDIVPISTTPTTSTDTTTTTDGGSPPPTDMTLLIGGTVVAVVVIVAVVILMRRR
ncbi:MAG: hypothetical protein ACFFEE_12840, partial [Candidatus Thorarchaeota archaeon]